MDLSKWASSDGNNWHWLLFRRQKMVMAKRRKRATVSDAVDNDELAVG